MNQSTLSMQFNSFAKMMVVAVAITNVAAAIAVAETRGIQARQGLPLGSPCTVGATPDRCAPANACTGVSVAGLSEGVSQQPSPFTF